jgi:hypothetical protein
MNVRIEDYLGRLRDARVERELAQKLLAEAEEDRFTVIAALLDHDVPAGLSLANKCLRGKKFFREILARGLRTADASDIEHWLKCVIPRLGFKATVVVIGECLAHYPEGVSKALYWLPSLLPPGDTEARNALAALLAGGQASEGRSASGRASDRAPETPPPEGKAT